MMIEYNEWNILYKDKLVKLHKATNFLMLCLFGMRPRIYYYLGNSVTWRGQIHPKMKQHVSFHINAKRP